MKKQQGPKEAPTSSKEYQEKGNTCMKDGKHFEAVLSYTFAIKLDLRNTELYSNRSLAFLKTGQLYYALEDALQTIKLKPQWAKGHFRKGEVYFAANQYIEAAEAYEEAYRLQPNDKTLNDLVRQCHRELAKMKKQDQQMPWLGCAIGLLIGFIAIVFDYLILESVLFTNLFIQSIVCALVSATGYYIAVIVRNQIQSYRNTMIEKPVDLFEN